jgi:hypothetical protein
MTATKDPAVAAILRNDEEGFFRAIDAEAKRFEDPAYCAARDAEMAQEEAKAEELGRIADAYLDAPDDASRAEALRLMQEKAGDDAEIIRWALAFAYNAETGREWTDEELAVAAAYMRRGEDPWEAAAAICEGFEL